MTHFQKRVLALEEQRVQEQQQNQPSGKLNSKNPRVQDDNVTRKKMVNEKTHSTENEVEFVDAEE